MSFAKAACAIAGALTAFAGTVALADPIVGNCQPTMAKYMASDELRFRTTSTSYVDVPQAKVGFRIGGASPGCVLVRFSAVPEANSFSNTAIRAFLDGSEAGLPFELQITAGTDAAPQARRYTFIFADVAPGAHTVSIQYRRLGTGGTADINAHNTIVWFTP